MTPQVIWVTLPMVPWNIGKLWALELPVRQVEGPGAGLAV